MSGRKIGYARVSTSEQNLALQIDALTAAGCADIFTDQAVRGDALSRAGLEAALAALQAGDQLIVWKLDRLGRSLGFLCRLLAQFEQGGIDFHSLTDGIDTTTAGGRLIFHIMGALAQFETDLIRERTKAGMKAAKQRGKRIGRPKAMTDAQHQHMQALLAQGKTQKDIAELLGVSHNTIWRAVKATNQETA